MIKHLVIMAAGRSTRMWPLTEYVPKAMALANDKTLLQNTIEKYSKLVMNIHITVGYKSDILSKHALGLGVSSIINTNGRGNSWWVHNTLISKINEPVLVLTCDSLMDFSLEKLEKEYLSLGQPAAMILPATVKENFEGDYIEQTNGLVTGLTRKNKTSVYCSGCQVVNPKKVCETIKPTDDFLDLWSQLIEKKQLGCASFTAENWFSFDTVEQLKLYRQKNG